MVGRCCAAAGSKAGTDWPSSCLARRPTDALGAPSASLMQRHHRLASGKRISEVHREGRSAANGLLVIRALPNTLGRSRFCFIAGKRVGNAVVRNRVKRRLREVVRQADTAAGWDTIFIARSGAGQAAFGQLESAAHNLMRRTRLLDPGRPATARSVSSERPAR